MGTYEHVYTMLTLLLELWPPEMQMLTSKRPFSHSQKDFAFHGH